MTDTCQTCGGSGIVSASDDLGPGSDVTNSFCPDCHKSGPVGTQARYDELTQDMEDAEKTMALARQQRHDLMRGRIRVHSDNGSCNYLCVFYRNDDHHSSPRCAIDAARSGDYRHCHPTDKCPGNGFYRLVREDD